MSKQGVLLVVGDWNAPAGNSKEENVIGLYGLGNRNEAEQLTANSMISSLLTHSSNNRNKG